MSTSTIRRGITQAANNQAAYSFLALQTAALAATLTMHITEHHTINQWAVGIGIFLGVGAVLSLISRSLSASIAASIILGLAWTADMAGFGVTGLWLIPVFMVVAGTTINGMQHINDANWTRGEWGTPAE